MRILFMGDSITDADRDRSDPHNLSGYSFYVAKILGDKNEYLNLGIAMEKSRDILARYDRDIKPYKPDIMVLLAGTNDVWHAFNREEETTCEDYYNNMKAIITRTKSDSPNTKIIVMEPYLLPDQKKAYWRPYMIKFIDTCRKIAAEYADGFIPLDGLFAKEQIVTPWQQLAADGVHPAEPGQKMIARYVSDEIKLISAKYGIK